MLLLRCFQMAWAVYEAHVEVSHHVLHGEICSSKDPHISHARQELEDELAMVVTEAEELLRDLHIEHFSLMQLVHTVIASRTALNITRSKIDGMVHKGVVRDSKLGYQLLLPPANWCPIFASRTTQASSRRPTATRWSTTWTCG